MIASTKLCLPDQGLFFGHFNGCIIHIMVLYICIYSAVDGQFRAMTGTLNMCRSVVHKTAIGSHQKVTDHRLWETSCIGVCKGALGLQIQ